MSKRSYSKSRGYHYADNPNIRRKYGEAERVNMSEPYEVAYAKKHRPWLLKK